jgi:capsular exopolysaccharide synthesis family protein
LSSAPADSESTAREDKPLVAYLRVIVRYRLMVAAVFVSVVALAALKSYSTRPLYKAEAQILIERENPAVLTFKGVADVNERGWADDYYQTQYKLLQSRSLARKVVLELRLQDDPEFGDPGGARGARGGPEAVDDAVDVFLDNLSVQWIRNSRLVTVGFESRRPELAARAANTLARAYIEQTLESRYETSAEASRWLARQIEDQRRKVQEAEIALQALREKEGIVNIDERRVLVEQRLKELGSTLTGLKSQRLQREALVRQMQGARDPEELPEALRSKLIESLRIELARLERQRAELQERYLEQHPEVLKVQTQIDETRRTIAGESARIVRAAENDYQAAAAQEKGVASALDAAKAEALDLQRRGVQYDSLKRELEAGKDVLNSLLARHEQADVAQELRSSNLRVADPATAPRAPFRPRHALDLLIGLLLGGGLSVALALLRDHLDDTLRAPDDVRLGLGAPLLAAVPLRPPSPEGEPGQAATKDAGAFREGYRLLRTALRHAWPDGAARVVLVTSTVPGEGKTATSVHLAQALAAAGERVLLVDADLRKPQAHDALGARRAPGLTDVLAGDSDLKDAIQTFPGGLGFLGSGTAGPGPADRLTVDRVDPVLAAARGLYRWVIVDTSPVGAVSDPLVLAPRADGVVVVAAAETVPRAAVRRTLERVAESGARVLGVVLNRARVDRYAYDYEHHYGHGYGAYHRAPAPPDIAPLNERVAP